MSDHFLDTSALAKHYHSEKGTNEVDSIWNDTNSRLFISTLSSLEIISAFAGKVRAGTISKDEFELLRRRFCTDIAQRRLLHVRITGLHYKSAEQLLRQHGFNHRLRTLDALQLSVVLSLRNRGVTCRFVCSDSSLVEVARIEGLPVLQPGSQSSS